MISPTPREWGHMVLPTTFVQRDLHSVGDVVIITSLPSLSQHVFPDTHFRLIRLGSSGQCFFVFFLIWLAAILNTQPGLDACWYMHVLANFASETPMCDLTYTHLCPRLCYRVRVLHSNSPYLIYGKGRKKWVGCALKYLWWSLWSMKQFPCPN